MKTFETLNAAYTARAQSRARKARATEAVDRAQGLHMERQAKLAELEAASNRQINERGRALAEALSAGAPSAKLPATAIVDDGAAALTSAKISAAIADAALTTLRNEDGRAQADLQAAEANVIACVDAIFADEKLAKERELTHHLNEALRIGKELRFTAFADEIHGRRQQPAKVTETLARLNLPLLDDLKVGTHILRFGDQDAAARRNARRVAMISADQIKEVEAA